MIKHTGIVLAILLLTGASTVMAQSTDSLATATARTFMEQLAKGSFAEAYAQFDEKVKGQITQEDLPKIWASITEKYGAFKKIDGTRSGPRMGYTGVSVTCEFEKEKVPFQILVTQSDKIVSFTIQPAKADVPYELPSYADETAYSVRAVRLGSRQTGLPGTLVVPAGEGPFPALVLVHGSGPNDRDETVGGNKPFKDLAVGLASRGIVVLRYDKRTYVYGAKAAASDSLTVKEETINDAVFAAEFLRGQKEVDPKRVFILGHSLGGMLIPRIGLATKDVAGFIIAEGCTRPLEDMIIEQMTYMEKQGGSGDTLSNEIQEVMRQARRIKDPKLAWNTPPGEILNAPASYWLDLQGYDPATVAKQVRRPMLIIQGGRDYQVTMTDFENWKKALSDRSDVQFELYPKLNHLMIAGEGPSLPAEYNIPGHVSVEVIEGIAGWIKQRGK